MNPLQTIYRFQKIPSNLHSKKRKTTQETVEYLVERYCNEPDRMIYCILNEFRHSYYSKEELHTCIIPVKWKK